MRRIDDYDVHEELEFCEVDGMRREKDRAMMSLFTDENSSEAHYVDLSKNPEKYTGYAGDSAVRVWKSTY